ncbi:hypothetical protein AGDE_07999 [Angomonas deanei]|uniref:KH domain containing protein, putative n=1 Tax=Angomonas deanei TaxID=59799 RepID=A0A7G2CN24_9TRYP|nr:hypothetical protein AGDE_07999 [Angomonas deanei]CAD2220344.1 KH domain containing protein, putative [Angomonas deanei]|eukprot:EPY34093.1 hypothetical protein AGDE_07999 [Angomonas deanei]
MTSKQIHEKFVSLRKKINDIQGQIVVLRKEQQTMREGDHAEDRAKERKLRTAMEEVDARLDHIRKTQLPVLHFQYDEAYRREIIGRAGATLLQLQLDFSVAVCIDDVEGGEGYIIGPRQNAQHCLEAIHAIVETSKAQGEQRTVVFDPSLKRQIIGAKGAKIAELERESGARLEVKDKEVILTGTKEAVEAGKALLEEFLDSFYTESLSFPPKMMSQVIGKAGATIKQVEASSGVRSLRVERESHKIVAAGAKRCVQEALRQYRELLGAAKGSTAVVHADDAMIRAVVGSKGSTVRQIEKETGARVSCEGTAITITGSPEAVEAAKAQVESHRRSEDRVSVDPVMLNFLTAEIVLKEEDGEEYLSPLEAICVATGCKVILPQRAESCVLLRGGPQNVAEAVRLLNQLLIRNIPKSFKVSYVEVLHNMLLSRPDEGGLNIIQQVQRSSPLLRVDIDRKTHSILVRSVDGEVAKTAAEELSKMVKQLADGHVRILSSIPSYKAGQLIGTRGATIREMEERTGTDIAVVKETEQIQIFHKDGDSEVLDNARQVILEFFEMNEDGDNELGTNDE